MDSVSSIPLSVGQEAMWIAWKNEPEAPVHIMPTPLEVHGTLDMPRLRAAVHALGVAYPHLRGRIQHTADGPILTWADAPRIPVAERNISLGRDEAVRQAWQRPFDLTAGPLARVHVLHGPGYTVLLLTAHHIVFDEASVPVLADALRKAYAGERLQTADHNGPLTEFARRPRELADTPAGDAHRARWRRLDAVSAPAEPGRAEARRASAVETKQLRRMAAVWEQVLKKDGIKPDDSFFTLGGHSVMAGALVSAAGERFGVRIPIRTLFEHSRLGEFTEHVLGLTAPTAPLPDAVSPDIPLAMTAFQRRIWLAELIDPSVRNHVPLAWRVEGRLDPGRLRVALGRLVAEHEILRTRFVDDEDGLSVRLREPWVPPLELLDLRNAPNGMMDWLEAALRVPFDLESGQLLRVALGDLGDGRQVLLFCLHHLVIDGESIPVLLAELDRHYTASGRSQPVVQYREFADYQRRQRESDSWSTDLEYWASTLEGACADTPLPAPRQPEPNGAFQIPLPVGLLDSLRAVQSEHGVSWFMVAATALAVTLHRWTGLDDVTFGSPTANRNQPRFAELLGPCLNTAVLRSRVTADSTLLDALLRMRGEALGALEHQAVQFDDVITRLNPVRRFGHTPYVNVTLNMNLLDSHAAVLGGTRLTPVVDDSLRSNNAKFGLTVTMVQQDGQLIGLMAYRGDQLGAEHARELADELAALLARFPKALNEPVMRRG
ncbi:condensation domain-containing protein [Streptomyces sp. NPDC001848]|uniref:condensation domain-containing protein n=1 Tax=Streptomyces sp. NPDC001848 TaxID=3364618 RepID=UPI0036CA81D6